MKPHTKQEAPLGVGIYRIVIFTLLTANPALADSAEWASSPSTGDWNTAGNWTPASVPGEVFGDIATFSASNTTGIGISAVTAVDSIVFESGASAFTITIESEFSLSLLGGFTNHSSATQNFVTASGLNGGWLILSGAADGNYKFTNTGGTVSHESGGYTEFKDISTAGSGTIWNTGGTASDTGGGLTVFSDSSSAANAGFSNRNGAAWGGGGRTSFGSFSTAAQGSFLNYGGTAVSPGAGSTRFGGWSNAGSGFFTNGSATGNGSEGGSTVFSDNSDASSGTFTNNGAGESFVYSGETRFGGASSAGGGNFINQGGTASDAGGGYTSFMAYSTATPAGGNFTNHGGTASGAYGGSTSIYSSATYINGIFTNHGGTVAGAYGGETAFGATSGTGSATLIANGGTGGGHGGAISFHQSATGGTALVKVYGNGNLDISNHDAPGVTIGSLEGTGVVFLGSRSLSLGSNHLTTTFSGVLLNGGTGGGTGGSLTKAGNGTTVLSGSNTYTGATIVSTGTLALSGSGAIANSSAIAVASGAILDVSAVTYVLGAAQTLSGKGSVMGTVITAANTAVIAPGPPTGTLTIGALNAANGCTFDFDLGTSSDALVIAGALTGSGPSSLRFNFTDAGGFAGGTAYTLLDYASQSGLDYEDLVANTLPPGLILDPSFGTGGWFIDSGDTRLQVRFIPGSVSAPEIAIEQPLTSNVADGGSRNFGSVALGANSSSTFTIKNTGTADLTGLVITKDGADSGDFTITASPTAPVAGPSGSTTFTVRFAPIVAGAKTAAIHIASNDADETPFDINLSGTGATAAAVFNDAIAANSGLTGSDALPSAIPFNDGVENLLKYAFNMNLAGPDSSSLVAGTGTAGLPAFALVGTGAATEIRMEFLRRKGSGLIYTAKHSADLTSFAPMTGTTTVTSINDHWERVLVQEPCNPATTPRCFGIVEVSLP